MVYCLNYKVRWYLQICLRWIHLCQDGVVHYLPKMMLSEGVYRILQRLTFNKWQGIFRFKLIGVNSYGSIFTKITDNMNTWIKMNTDGAEDLNLNFFHNCDCGRKNLKRSFNPWVVPLFSNRIINPYTVFRHEFPWMAWVVKDLERGGLPSNDKHER